MLKNGRRKPMEKRRDNCCRKRGRREIHSLLKESVGVLGGKSTEIGHSETISGKGEGISWLGGNGKGDLTDWDGSVDQTHGWPPILGNQEEC